MYIHYLTVDTDEPWQRCWHFMPKKLIDCNKRGADLNHVVIYLPWSPTVNRYTCQPLKLTTYLLNRPEDCLDQGVFQPDPRQWPSCSDLLFLCNGLSIFDRSNKWPCTAKWFQWILSGLRCCDGTLDHSGRAVHRRPFTIMHFQGRRTTFNSRTNSLGDLWLTRWLIFNTEALGTYYWQHTTSQK